MDKVNPYVRVLACARTCVRMSACVCVWVRAFACTCVYVDTQKCIHASQMLFQFDYFHQPNIYFSYKHIWMDNVGK